MKLQNNRKFIVVMTIIGVVSIAILSGKVESGDFANVLVAIGVAFMGGNAMEHWSKSKKKEDGDGGD